MIPLAVPVIGENEKKYLMECVETNFVSTAGPFVSRFEHEIAKVSGVKDAVALNSGTSAIHLSLIAAGVKHGDLVIAPELTFIASINAIAYCGADPWLFDITEESWTLDYLQLAKILKEKTEVKDGQLIHKPTKRRVAAILPVYTLGTPAHMDELMAIGREYNIPVIADAAAAIGAKYKGKEIGTCADYTTYSFNGNKTITSGGGGAIVSKHDERLKFIRHISTTARISREYIHDHVGYNYRLTNVEAAIGLGQIEKLNQFLSAKKQIRIVYDQCCESLVNFEKFPSPEYAESAYWFSGVVLKNGLQDKSEEVLSKLHSCGIEARSFWRPISSQAAFVNSPKEKTEFAEHLWKRVITLPCSTNLTKEELKIVTDALKAIDKEI